MIGIGTMEVMGFCFNSDRVDTGTAAARGARCGSVAVKEFQHGTLQLQVASLPCSTVSDAQTANVGRLRFP